MPDHTLFHPRHWPAWLAIALLRLLALLPLEWLLALANVIGALLILLPGRRQQITLANIRLCFADLPAPAQRRLARQSLAATVMGVFETAVSWWASDRRLAGRFSIEGGHLLQQAGQQGQGVLLLGLHFTTLDLAGRLLRQRHDVDVTYRRQNHALFDYFLARYRRRRFAHRVEKRQMRQMIRLLKQGRTVWYAIDQNYGKPPFVFAPFFGQPAATLASTGKILRMTGARPLLFCHYRLKQNGRLHYRLCIEDPFADGLGDDENDNARRLNAAYEQAIRRQPEQYLWTHRRFKTRPPGLPSLYAPKRRRRKTQKY